jgi:hypothetical protein
MRFSMRRACGALAVAAALVVSGAEAVPVVAGSPPQAIVAKHCKRGTPAVIGGASKCLQPGEYCAARHNRQYRHYGFVCRGGRLHRR